MTSVSPVFRTIVTRSWNIVWESPWLLGFGFLASFLSVGGFWEILFTANERSSAMAGWVTTTLLAVQRGSVSGFFHGLARAPRPAFLTFLLLLGILVVTVGVFWLANCGQGAIIDTTRKQTKGMKTTATAAWAVGRRSGWSLFGLNLGLRIVILLLFLVLGLLISFTAEGRMVGPAVAFVGLLVAVPLALVVALIGIYAASAIVVKGFSIPESVRYGLVLFGHHWLLSLEMMALFLLLGIVLGIITMLTATLLALPFFLLSLIATVFALPGSIGVIFFLWLLVVLSLAFLTASFFAAWHTTAWTLLFLRLEHSETPRPFLVRLTQKLFP